MAWCSVKKKAQGQLYLLSLRVFDSQYQYHHNMNTGIINHCPTLPHIAVCVLCIAAAESGASGTSLKFLPYVHFILRH